MLWTSRTPDVATDRLDVHFTPPREKDDERGQISDVHGEWGCSGVRVKLVAFSHTVSSGSTDLRNTLETHGFFDARSWKRPWSGSRNL